MTDDLAYIALAREKLDSILSEMGDLHASPEVVISTMVAVQWWCNKYGLSVELDTMAGPVVFQPKANPWGEA